MNDFNVNDLTDDELVSLAAEKVMGWRICRCESAYFDSYCNDEGEGEGSVEDWRPLINWNHAMEVVEKMRTKGWDFALEFEKGFRPFITFMWSGRGGPESVELRSDEDAKRSILRAVYMATTKTGGE